MTAPTTVPESAEQSQGAETAPAQPQKPRGRTASLAGAAGLIAVLTIVARLVGFGRIFVVSWALGVTSLGNIYQTINTLPNIIYEIVAGGALAAVVVPLLSSAIARGDTRQMNRTCWALLSWALLVLTPLALLVAVFAHPIVSGLLGSDASPTEIGLGTRMLWAFAPQLVLYGVGIVFTGVLQAHHRFAWPALAPLLSSVTVIIAYVTFAALAGTGATVVGLHRPAELVLSLGTTAGVAVLSLCLLIPMRRLGLSLRPSLQFPPGVARRAASLLGGGIAAVAAQQLTLLVVLRLAQRPVGATVTYGLAQTVFYVPWAVLAVPIATSAFPRLSAAFAKRDTKTFASTLSSSAQAVILLCSCAAALLIASSAGIAGVITGVAHGRNSTNEIAGALVGFAPGLVGFGLLALLSRSLYAAGISGLTAATTVAGWLVVIATDITLVRLVPVTDRVPALAAGHSVGMTLLGIALLLLCRNRLGGQVLVGVGRSLLVAVATGAIGACLGYAVSRTVGGGSLPVSLVQLVLAGAVAAIGFVAALLVLDRARCAVLWGLVSARLRFGRQRGSSASESAAPSEPANAADLSGNDAREAGERG